MLVILNQGAGAVAPGKDPGEPGRIVDLFKRHGIDAELRTVPPGQLLENVQGAISGRWEAVVAGGGDGTVRSVAGALAGTHVPLGVLPLGTYNHFARDLDLPLELEPGIRAIAEGQARSVDVAEVNEQCFVNNSSIGIYPHAVTERETLRRQTGGDKRRLMLWATVKVLLRKPLMKVRLEIHNQVTERTTPFVLVVNNRYTQGLLSGKLRARLDEGCLSVFAARDLGLLGFARVARQALRDPLENCDDLDSWTAAELRIHTRRHRVRVALDGEVIHLESPLRYRIRPRALRVIR